MQDSPDLFDICNDEDNAAYIPFQAGYVHEAITQLLNAELWTSKAINALI
jgi:hypothetical protein